MAASVQVLCPNGRRQTVKINPNTKLLLILEEVCQRQGFIPPEDYKLVQGRKDFDLSLSVRFASIPNNAKLELVRCALSRTEQEVTIALQLASGQRHQECFQPSVSLWDILARFESKITELNGLLTGVDTSQSPALHPVCIYMREEVVGEQALKAMTLKKLGLTCGKAIIRHIHRKVEDGVLGGIVDQVEKDRRKQAKLEEIAVKKNDELLEQQREEERKKETRETMSQFDDISETVDEPMETSTDTTPVSSACQVTRVQHRGNETGQDQGVTLDSSVTSTTGNDQQVQARSSNDQLQTTAIQDLRNLNIPGVDIFTPDDFNDLTPQEQAIAQRLAARFLPHLQGQQQAQAIPNTDRPTSSQASDQQSDDQSFQNFKFPESTKGKDLRSQQQGSTLSSACDREAILYDGNETLETNPAAGNRDLPDDFFEVTQSDVKLLYKDLKNAVNSLEDQPLMTNTMRRERAEGMFDNYDRIVIRVQFPDRTVLQGLFRPREPVSALRAFVQENIKNKKDKFYLYTAPPKEVIQDYTASLALSKLAPASFVYYGSETQRETYLTQAMRERLRPRIEAELVVRRILQPNTEPQPSTSGTSSGERRPAESTPFGNSRMSGGTSSSSHASSSSRSTLPSGTQVPKWLKLGKK